MYLYSAVSIGLDLVLSGFATSVSEDVAASSVVFQKLHLLYLLVWKRYQLHAVFSFALYISGFVVWCPD